MMGRRAWWIAAVLVAWQANVQAQEAGDADGSVPPAVAADPPQGQSAEEGEPSANEEAAPEADRPEIEPPPEMPLPEPEPEQPPLSDEYGFLPLEVYKIDSSISTPRTADLTGNGRLDVVVFNADANRVDLLLQRDEGQPIPDSVAPSRPNQLASSQRLQHERVPLDRPVSSGDDLILADVNGDGRPDLVHTSRDELVVRLNQGTDDRGVPEWSPSVLMRLRESGIGGSWRLAHATLDGQDRSSVFAMSGQETLILTADDEAQFDQPRRLSNTASTLTRLWVADLDGDGRKDLIFYDSSDDEFPLVVRLATQHGEFGPEHRLKIPPPRALDILDLDGKAGAEVLLLERATGRLRVYSLRWRETPDVVLQPLVQYGLPNSSNTPRAFGVGDIDGDGRDDVVLADTTEALMHVFLQDKDGGLRARQEFPGLLGISSLAIAATNRGGRSELYLASEREKVLATSRWQKGRLTFPEVLPLANTSETPVAVAVADLEGDGRAELVYTTHERAGARQTLRLRALRHDRDDGWTPADFADTEAVELDSTRLRAAPRQIVALDADRDGRDDLLLLGDRAPLTYLGTSPLGIPQWTEGVGDRLGEASPLQVTVARVGGYSIFVANRGFSRRFGLDATGRWVVRDQYNANAAGADIVATAVMNIGEREPVIVLVDSGTRRLRLLRREDGLYRPWRTMPLPSLAIQGVATADLNGDGRDDLVLLGGDRMLVSFSGEGHFALTETSHFESELETGRPSNFVVGDLGGGREPEVALVDTGENRIELITLRDGRWASALRFRVFETAPSQTGGGEPRASLVADLTGNGLDDLLLIAQDRVLIYRQDPGVEEDPADDESAKSDEAPSDDEAGGSEAAASDSDDESDG